VFIKRALNGKTSHNGSPQILQPDEVLDRLNREILEADLDECRFVALTYAVLNTRTLELSLARGGAPYPILRRADGETRLIRAHGALVGVIPDATFTVEHIQMRPGDALLLYTDGVENLVTPSQIPAALAESFARSAMTMRTAAMNRNGINAGALTATLDTPTEPEPRPDELIAHCDWYQTLGRLGVAAAMAECDQRFNILRRLGRVMDDTTILAMNIAA
jgi:hypothetical protein